MDLRSAGLKREDLTKMPEGKAQFHILVVEDEAKVAGALREGLEREKYEVVVAPTGEEGFFLVNAEEFDLVLLDLMLPGRDGLQVLSTLRKRGLQTPVLILTARDAIEDRVEGLDKGADDYLVKPFAFPELLARVRALLRRGRTEQAVQLRLADLEMDAVTRKARRGGHQLDLTAREFELLEYLLRHKEQVVSREMLTKEPNGGVSLHSSHPDAAEPRIGHFIEVWSPQGALLYRSASLQDQALGSPPGPDEGLHDPTPSSARLPNGTRLRLASGIYHIEDQRIVLRVAYSQEALWRELREFGEVLLLGFPIAVLLAGFGGYALVRRALSPIDLMATQAKTISAEKLGDRLSIENPEDELGKLGSVFNAMLGRLQAAFDQLRRFTADASHELRTPLTAIRSVGEIALQH